jgi:hypothetical protein
MRAWCTLRECHPCAACVLSTPCWTAGRMRSSHVSRSPTQVTCPASVSRARPSSGSCHVLFCARRTETLPQPPRVRPAGRRGAAAPLQLAAKGRRPCAGVVICARGCVPCSSSSRRWPHRSASRQTFRPAPSLANSYPPPPSLACTHACTGLAGECGSFELAAASDALGVRAPSVVRFAVAVGRCARYSMAVRHTTRQRGVSRLGCRRPSCRSRFRAVSRTAKAVTAYM